MSKEQVMDYVMNSPANTNPNVLSGMLDGISGTQLPSPTESDNGKVLGVDGGEYKLVEQSGGVEVEIKNLTNGVDFWRIGNLGFLRLNNYSAPVAESEYLFVSARDASSISSELSREITPLESNTYSGSLIRLSNFSNVVTKLSTANGNNGVSVQIQPYNSVNASEPFSGIIIYPLKNN